MPRETTLKFRNVKNRIKCPAVVYCDFEAMNIEVSENVPSSSKTEKVCEQVPTGVGYVVCSEFEHIQQSSYVYRGEDAADHLMERLHYEYDRIKDYLYANEDIITTEQDEIDFNNAEECHLCRLPFEDSDVKVKDHCHISSIYRGAAHSGLD